MNPYAARSVIHYVDSDTFGGSEQSLLHLIAGLDRARWRPLLLLHPAPGLARLVDGARAAGVPVRTVPRVTDRDVLTRMPALLAAVGTGGPAVLHAHLNWPLAGKFGLLAATLRRIPAVATAQLFVESLVNRNVRAQFRVVSAGVRRYLAVSRHVAARLGAAFGVPDRKLSVVYNGIDPAPFERAADPALRARITGNPLRPLVFTAARLTPQKGLDVLLDAAVRVPGAVFAIAGEGPERAALEARAAALGLTDRVRFLGARSDVADLLVSSDLFVLPSRFEGLPLSVLEAMAAGKAVVASRIGGTDEAVADGISGTLVPPGDPAALAVAVCALLGDPARAGRMGDAGRAAVHERFTAREMARAVAAVYDEVLAR
ncbi:MAG TPA: glycosyltransferase family 4 protein [Gemmatimonadales bacterium]|nr:glycosyltransferase family 4 protein [Gemmatimonadales bacterium]